MIWRYTFSIKEYLSDAELYLYAYRVYDPIAGRWTQRDPIDYEDSVNLYQFCGNNPVNGVDELGLRNKDNNEQLANSIFKENRPFEKDNPKANQTRQKTEKQQAGTIRNHEHIYNTTPKYTSNNSKPNKFYNKDDINHYNETKSATKGTTYKDAPNNATHWTHNDVDKNGKPIINSYQKKTFGKVVHVAGPYFNKRTKKLQVIVFYLDKRQQ